MISSISKLDFNDPLHIDKIDDSKRLQIGLTFEFDYHDQTHN